MWRVTVIEDDMRAAGQAGKEGERGPDGLFRKVGNDSEPSEECMLRGIEAGGGQAFGKGLVLEVDGREGQRRRNGDCGIGQTFAFPGLRGGMIDFENTEAIAERAAIGVSVEASSQYDELASALPHGGG